VYDQLSFFVQFCRQEFNSTLFHKANNNSLQRGTKRDRSTMERWLTLLNMKLTDVYSCLMWAFCNVLPLPAAVNMLYDMLVGIHEKPVSVT